MVECERVAGGRCLLEVAMVECERVAGGRCLLEVAVVECERVGGACRKWLWWSVRGWEVLVGSGCGGV